MGATRLDGKPGKYQGHFASRDDLVACYDERRVPPEEQIVYAWHSDPDYSEDLVVVFVRDGVFYEVSDGHCSCNDWDEDGLLWDRPEQTSVGALLMRADKALANADGAALTAMEASQPGYGLPDWRRALALRD